VTTPLTGLLVFLALLSSCTKEINRPQYIVDQEVGLHWVCVTIRCTPPYGTAWNGIDDDGDEDECSEDDISRDTILVHSIGTVDDATAQCYNPIPTGGLMPASPDSCYCLDELVF